MWNSRSRKCSFAMVKPLNWRTHGLNTMASKTTTRTGLRPGGTMQGVDEASWHAPFRLGGGIQRGGTFDNSKRGAFEDPQQLHMAQAAVRDDT